MFSISQVFGCKPTSLLKNELPQRYFSIPLSRDSTQCLIYTRIFVKQPRKSLKKGCEGIKLVKLEGEDEAATEGRSEEKL